jgi:hypothetical protein
MLSIQSILQLFNRYETVAVLIDLFEQQTKLMNLFFRNLSRYVSDGKGFELNDEIKFTFENFENAFSFLKSIGRGTVLAFPAFIHGCSVI